MRFTFNTNYITRVKLPPQDIFGGYYARPDYLLGGTSVPPQTLH